MRIINNNTIIAIVIIILFTSLNIFSQNLTKEVSQAIEGKNEGEKIDLLIDFGDSFYKSKQYSKSVNCYNAASTIYLESNNNNGVAYCCNKIGNSYVKNKNYKKAISAFKKAKQNYASSNKKQIFNVTFNLADAYTYNKQYKIAIKYYKEAAIYVENINDHKNLAYIYNQIAGAYANWGNVAKAITYYKKAETKAGDSGLKSLELAIAQNIKDLEENISNKQAHVTEYDKQKKKEEKVYVENLKNDFESKKQEHLFSLKEISKLSYENQAKQYKLHAINEKYNKEVAENKLNAQEIKNLEQEKTIHKLEILQKENEINNQRKVLVIIGASLILLILLFFFIVILYRQKRKNLFIVEKQKEEINQHNTILNKVNEEIASQRDTLEEQNDNITKSILYAEKIQNSILPSQNLISQNIANFFVLFKPKDIVSGDFYWFYKKGDSYWGAIVDCTGHGVPGAFMSMIGNSLLNKIILEEATTTPSGLLTKLNKELKYALGQSKREDASDDGMDMTVVKINQKKKEMLISLANHSAIVVKENKAEIIEGDIYSIGGLFSDMEDLEFTDKVVDISKGTSIYMYSDGYQDQFGGPKNKKYTPERLKDKIIELQNLKLSEQNKALEHEIEEWKGNTNQIDDILVVGIKF